VGSDLVNTTRFRFVTGIYFIDRRAPIQIGPGGGVTSLECAGQAALWPNVSRHSPYLLSAPQTVRRQATADQSGAGPPHSKGVGFDRAACASDNQS
jgi:hypothetical protein